MIFFGHTATLGVVVGADCSIKCRPPHSQTIIDQLIQVHSILKLSGRRTSRDSMEGGNCKAMLLWVALLAMPLLACCNFSPAGELRHWSFDNTLADVSPAHRAAAVIVSSNVALAQDKDIDSECCRIRYVRIRQPGYLNLPAVRLYDTSFTITFTLRIPSYPSSNQLLFADWSPTQWQFWS